MVVVQVSWGVDGRKRPGKQKAHSLGGGGRAKKKNKQHPYYFFHVGCGAPIYEKVRGPMAERAHLLFVAE